MAKKININGDSSDPFYRYKMQEVIVRQQGAFYAFLNVDDICAEKGGINRPLADVQKFLNKNLHTSFTYKNKSLITSAPITKDSIQNMIFQYINKFILCTKCASPETIVNKIKTKTYNICKACGNSDEVLIDGIIQPIKKKDIKKKYKDEITHENIEECNKKLNNDIIQLDKIDEELEDLINNI
jgi:translation initiation factor 2 beta subunit (eIF-2beta)/eIF-5